MNRTYVHPNDCDCYKCVGSRIQQDGNGHAYVANNMEHHTFGDPCESCGRPKSEYRDLGRKGRYVCWWCTKRANGRPYNPTDVPVTTIAP